MRGTQQHASDLGDWVVQGTLLMAMANGLPVVSTPYRFALEVLQPQQRGLLVPFSDEGPLLQETICRLLGDEQLRSAMVQILSLALHDVASPCCCSDAQYGGHGSLQLHAAHASVDDPVVCCRGSVPNALSGHGPGTGWRISIKPCSRKTRPRP